MDLREVIYYNRNKLLQLDQVVGVGRGFKEVKGEPTRLQSIQVFVRKKLSIEQLRARDIIPGKIDGFLTDVIEVGQIHAIGVRTERLRPAQPGVSLAHYLVSAGTFGAVVYDQQTGQPLILSNNHILANSSFYGVERASIGDPILQPGPYDNGSTPGDVIGYLERYVPLQMKITEQVGFVGRGLARAFNTLLRMIAPGQDGIARYELKIFRRGGENIVDCAVAVPVDPDQISDEILGIGRVAGVRRPEVGDILLKSGRTSGVTRGRVRSVDATVTVEMGEGEEALFTDQILVDMVSEGGDSGSLVLDENRNACGLLFAGSSDVTVCNPIDEVLKALNVTF